MKTGRSFRHRIVLSALALACAAVVTGCVGVVPVPAFPDQVQRGRRIQRDEVTFVKPGQTQRAEVVEVLGTDYVEFPWQPAVAYTWEIGGGGAAWWVVGYMGGASGRWVGGWRAYFIAFDEDGTVRAAEFRRLAPNRCLHQHLGKWLDDLPLKKIREADPAIAIVSD